MRKLIVAVLLAFCASTADARAFSFIAYGDTGYKVPRDLARVERLVDQINAEKPAFAIHVGDFKGYSSCSDAAYQERKTLLDRHDHPLVLTPGDNDWTDCDAETAGGFQPLERLGALRRIFFADQQSLGRIKRVVDRQNPHFPENQSWTHEGVIFATVHAVGPHNNLVLDKGAAAESIDRSLAGQAWIRRAFERARAARAPAIVIAFQIDPWIASAPAYERGPVEWLRRVIGEEAANFAGQVLVVHGDSHRLTIDTPLRRTDIDAGTTSGMNVTRLQVPGWPDHRAVRIDVDPSSSAVFRFGLVMSPSEALGARP